MSFARGRFGVEYHPRDSEETHVLRWLVIVVAALALIAFLCFQISRSRGRRTPPSAPETTTARAPLPSATTNRTDKAEPHTASKSNAPRVPDALPREPVPAKPLPATKPASKPKAPPEAQALLDKVVKTMNERPTADRVLLERLVAAERQANDVIAADTIRRLYSRPTMADLRDPLMRRLGDLNLRQLFSGKPTPWTTAVTVRPGDGRERIAREHRTTIAAVERLNPSVKWEKLKPGDVLQVMDFPSAALVVHPAGFADLSLNKNGQFFRRYYLSVSKSVQAGVYAISSESGTTLHARFRELGLHLAPGDRAELEMFLPPGSRIVVSTEQ